MCSYIDFQASYNTQMLRAFQDGCPNVHWESYALALLNRNCDVRFLHHVCQSDDYDKQKCGKVVWDDFFL